MFKDIKHREVLNLAKLADRIKLLRTSAGLTQEEFGKIFGIVKSTVSLYESGKSCPNDQIKLRICDYFHVPLDYLIGLSNVSTIECTGFSKTIMSDGTCHSRFLDLCESNKKGIEDLANGTGLDKELLENWFLKEVPSLEQLVLVADFFNTSVDYLLGRTENPSNISTDEQEIFSYYNQLSKLDQRWIVGQMIDLIKSKSPIPEHPVAAGKTEERKVSGK